MKISKIILAMSLFCVLIAVSGCINSTAPVKPSSHPAIPAVTHGHPAIMATQPPQGSNFKATKATAATIPIFYTKNYAGYGVTGAVGTINSVSGAWTVPAVKSSSIVTYSSTWVGLDGDATIEQCGTDQIYDPVYGPVYDAWVEFYPEQCYVIPLNVKAGDRITADVTAKSGIVTMTLKDTTNSQTSVISRKTTGMELNSAEWIEEAPWSYGVLPLANFGGISFTGCKATLKTTSTAIEKIPTKQMNEYMMVNDYWGPKAYPGVIKAGSFPITFVSN